MDQNQPRYITAYYDEPEARAAANADEFIWPNMWGEPTYLIDTHTNTIVMSDEMEPEDATFGRSLAPLVDLLNEQAAEIARLWEEVD